MTAIACVPNTTTLHLADLPTSQLPAGASLVFSLYWPEEDRWENENLKVEI